MSRTFFLNSYADGMGSICQAPGGNRALNPSRYIGDTIVITMTQTENGTLNCDCTRSACDVSVSSKKTI